jgi:hypothetical protein
MSCNHSIPDPSCDACGLFAITRNNNFDGKLLTAYHFEKESEFVRGLHRRHNSFLHGMGTVCGLRVHEHDDENCRRQYVVLEPGLALDCCGHEIVVSERRTIDVARLIAEALAEQGRKPRLFEGENLTVRIQLAYREVGKDPVPALLDECDIGNAEECDLIAEDYEVLVSAVINEVTPPVEGVLEPKLEWKLPLNVGLPQAAAVDRELERLYVAETDDQGGYLRVYHTKTHLLLNRAQVLAAEDKDRGIKAIALSRGGGRIYLAIPPSDDGSQTGSILVIERLKLENGTLPDPLPTLSLPANQNAIHLDVTVRDDALLALGVDLASGENAVLYRWSAEQIGQLLNGTDPSPVPADRNLTDLLRAVPRDPAQPEPAILKPVDMEQSIDGRWLILADNNPQGTPLTGRLVIISLPGFDSAVGSPADFIKDFALPSDQVALAVGLSYDGSFLHALCRYQSRESYLLRIKVDDTSLLSYIPHPADTDQYRELPLILEEDAHAEPDTFKAIDLAVTPRDNFVYILRRRMNAGAQVPRGDILIADVDRMDDRLVERDQPEIFKRTLRRGAALEDLVDFQVLSPLGSRLYAASHRADTSEGMLRVYEIDESSCDTYFRNAILKGCDGCATTQPVTIASFQQFILDALMVDVDPGTGNPFNLIDNFTHRETAPSTNTLRDVIQCMLDKGFNEGVPGPRGDQGPQGNPGQPGQPGEAGQRGRGVTEGRRDVGPVDARLEEIDPADPNSDFRLVVTLPDVTGGPQPPSFNHVQAANFVHEEIFFDDVGFATRMNGQMDGRLFGLLIAFEQPVLARTLNNRTVQVLANHQGRFLQPESLLPMQVIPVNFEPQIEPQEVAFLDGYAFGNENGQILILDNTIQPVFALDDPGEPARGVLLRPDPSRARNAQTWFLELLRESEKEVFPRDLDERIAQLPELLLLSIVLRGNYILTKEGLELEATPAEIHRRRGLVDGSSTVPMSGDWVSFIHLVPQVLQG